MKLTLIPRALVLSGCLVLCMVVLAQASRSEPTPLRAPLTQMPMELGGWHGVKAADLEPDVLQVLRVDEYLNRVYRRDSSAIPVGLYIGYYQSQRQGETMHSPLNCLPGSGWQPVRSGRTTISMEGATASAPPVSIEINRYVVQKGTESVLVLYWYQSHGRVVASEYWGKFYTVLDAIRMNRTDAALVRVIIPVVNTERGNPGAIGGEARSEEVGVDFVRKLFPQLANHLPI